MVSFLSVRTVKLTSLGCCLGDTEPELKKGWFVGSVTVVVVYVRVLSPVLGCAYHSGVPEIARWMFANFGTEVTRAYCIIFKQMY